MTARSTRSFVPLHLESPRLILRHFKPADLPTLLAYRNDSEVARYQGWRSPTEAEAQALIDVQSVQPVAVPEQWLQIALELKATGQHIGDLAFKVADEQAVFGYSLSHAFQGQGLMTEAASTLLTFLFAELRLHRVSAQADVRNSSSVRLLERLGLRREAHYLEAHFLRGEWTSEYLYAVLAREWAAVQPEILNSGSG